jgi:hypothetical protein
MKYYFLTSYIIEQLYINQTELCWRIHVNFLLTLYIIMD